MSYLEVYYNPSSCDWDLQADRALEQIDYIPGVILLYPREDSRQLPLFKDSENAERNDRKSF